MPERKGPHQTREVAMSVVRDFIAYPNALVPFTKLDYQRMNNRFAEMVPEERDETARVLFGGVIVDSRPSIRKRAGDMVRSLYEGYTMPAAVYVDVLAKLITPPRPDNLTDLLQLAPHAITETEFIDDFDAIVDRLAVYYRDNERVLKQMAVLKRQLREVPLLSHKENASVQEVGSVDTEVLVFAPSEVPARSGKDVPAEVRDRLRADLPNLWNRQKLPSVEIAALYGVTLGYVHGQMSLLRKNGIFLEPRLAQRPNPGPRESAIPSDVQKRLLADLPDLWNTKQLSSLEISALYDVPPYYVMIQVQLLRSQGIPLVKRIGRQPKAIELPVPEAVQGEKSINWISPEYRDRIREEMPALWNDYHLTSGQLAGLYGVSPRYLLQQKAWLQEQGVSFQERENDSRKIPLPTKLASIPRLATFLSPQEVARTLSISLFVVKHHWPKEED